VDAGQMVSPRSLVYMPPSCNSPPPKPVGGVYSGGVRLRGGFGLRAVFNGGLHLADCGEVSGYVALLERRLAVRPFAGKLSEET